MAYYSNDRVDVPRLEYFEKQKLDDELTEQRIKTQFHINSMEHEIENFEKAIASTGQIDIHEVTKITDGIKKETTFLAEGMRLEIGRNNLRFRKEIDSLRKDVAKTEIKAHEIEQKIQKISDDFNRKIESLLKRISLGKNRAAAYMEQLHGLYDEIMKLHPDKLTPGEADTIQKAISDVSSNINSGSYDAAIGRAQGCIPEAGELKARLILMNDEYIRLCQQIYQLSDSLLKRIDQLKDPSKNVQMIDEASEQFDGRISFWTSALFDETVEYYLSVMKDVSASEDAMDIDGLKRSLSQLEGVSDKLDQCVIIAHAEFVEHDKASYLAYQIYESMIRYWDISNDEDAFGFDNDDERQSYRMTFLNNSGMSATFIVMPNSHFKLHVRCIDEPQDTIRCNTIFDGVIQDLMNNGIPVDDGMQNDSKSTLMAFLETETKTGDRIKSERIREKKQNLDYNISVFDKSARGITMKKIGLDFGTTYSMISQLVDVEYDKNNKIKDYRCEGVTLFEGGSPAESTIAVRDEDTFYYGRAARDEIGTDGVIVYKGFKMLLSENDPEILCKRGYDSTYTPASITRQYIDDLLSRYIKEQSADDTTIEKLVVGVPEIWFDKGLTVDARSVLYHILTQEMTYVSIKDVELVSEPAAACAFFVENYRKIKNKKFKGHIILIDYGGGTLDISLCRIKADGKQSEVTPIARWGEGANKSPGKESEIGIGGMAYIEKVVEHTLAESGIDAKQIEKNGDFYKCVNQVETHLITQAKEIEDKFKFGARISLDDVSFRSITYKQKKYTVTYECLRKTYAETIEPVLDKQLEKAICYAKENGIVFDKIVPVGGFSNYFLTRNQIKKKFVAQVGDDRYDDILFNNRDREKAVSYGAALIANDIIRFVRLAPYTLSLVGKKSDGTPDFSISYHVVHYGDKIEYEKPIMIKCEDGITDNLFKGDMIPYLKVVHNSGLMELRPAGEYTRLENNHVYKLGFSFNKSLELSFHDFDMGDINEQIDETAKGIERIRPLKDAFEGIIELKGESDL